MVDHDTPTHHVKEVRPHLSVLTGTDDDVTDGGPVVAMADDISRTASVITRRQAAQLEAIVGGSLPYQAMPASHEALMVQSSPDPVSKSEARSGTEWKSWEAAIKVELSLKKELGV